MLNAEKHLLIVEKPGATVVHDGFTAIVVTYHTGPIVFQCLTALAKAPLCTQVILVNNGNTSEVTNDLRAFCVANPKVQMLDGHGNIGFGAACNLGAAIASALLLVFVNPDCVIDPRTLPAFNTVLKAQSGALVGGALRDRDGREQRGARRGEMTLLSACISFAGLGRAGPQAGIWRDFNRHHEDIPTELTPMPTISGALFALHRSTFDLLKGFDPAYFLHVEDIDLCKRARALGHLVLYAPDATALHIGSTSAVSGWAVEKEKIKSFFYYFWTHARGLSGRVAVLLVMPFLASAIIARLVVSQVRSPKVRPDQSPM